MTAPPVVPAEKAAVGAEGDAPGGALEQGHAAVGVDRDVVAGADHRGDADLLRQPGEDAVAVVEGIGHVGCRPRSRGSRRWLAASNWDRRSLMRETDSARPASACMRTVWTAAAPLFRLVGEVARPVDRVARERRVVGLVGRGLQGGVEGAEARGRRGAVAGVADGALEGRETVEHGLAGGHRGGPGELSVEQGDVGGPLDRDRAAPAGRHQVGDLAACRTDRSPRPCCARRRRSASRSRAARCGRS